jgi:hypothetical protein
MARKIKDDPIYTAITSDDVSGLRRLAATVKSSEQRMWLQLLAEFIEDRVQREARVARDVGQRRRLPVVGIFPARSSVK